MELEILDVYKNLYDYVIEMENDPGNCEMLWNKYAIEPYWKIISHWAPFDMSDRKPKPIKNIAALKLQLKQMKEIDITEIRKKLIEITEMLPNYDDDPITIAIYPVDDDNLIVKQQQNGVWGVNVFGNIILNINPLCQNYLDWIPYVFAHEYHHTVWGNYWHVIHGGRTGSLIEALLIDGQADYFAKGFNPSLNPSWISQISKEQEKELWNKYYLKMLGSTDFDYCKYMFGDDEAVIPWCTGYFFGYRIIESFKKNYPEINVRDMLEMSSEKIFEMSNYGL